MAKKPILLIIIASILMVPMVHGLTIDGPTNFEGPGGGIVRFEDTSRSTQLNIMLTIQHFRSFISDGEPVGNVGFDCDTGDVMIITNTKEDTLSYTISGAGQQRIYYLGYARPNTITGGIVSIGGSGNIIVTTLGAGTVTLTWLPEINYLASQLFGYLAVFAMIPLAIAGMAIRGVMNGSLSQDEFTKALSAIVVIVIVGFVAAMLIKNMAGI